MCTFVLLIGGLPWLMAAPGAFFAPNRGQAPGDVRYLVRASDLTGTFTESGAHLYVGGAAVSLEFKGSAAHAIEPAKSLPGVINVLAGADPRAWQTGSPTYASIAYRDLYPGVDAIYNVEAGRLKCEFRIAPGADPSLIRVSYRGHERISVDQNGGLIVSTKAGVFREDPPEIYQPTGTARRPVQGGFRLNGDRTVSFDVADYDRSLPLIIDPVISASTYLGGSRFDVATSVAVDAGGNVYMAGWTESSDLTSVGTGSKPGVNAFVAKFLSDGQTLVYCTYLGGSGNDQALGLAVDAAGNALVTGWTDSTDFPAVNAIQPSLSGFKDAFIAKLNQAGSGLLFSTYFGGSATESGNAIALDSAGNAYVAGETTSASGFRSVGPFQAYLAGETDAFVLKISSTGASLLYATYIGGSGEDRARSIAVDAAGQAHISGDTASTNFPTKNAFQQSSGGKQDAFIVKLNTLGTGLVFGTYLGGSNDILAFVETAAAVALDAAGNVYLAGTTGSSNFPIVNASAVSNGSSDAFLCKMNGDGAVQYSTRTGGGSIEIVNAIAVSSGTGTAYVAGYTASSDLPGAASTQSSHHGLYDAFVVQFGGDGHLVQSLYIGGSDIDAANAIALDSSGQLLVAGQTSSTDFPVVNGYQISSRGQIDTFLIRATMEPNDGWYFVPITPCRVIDTRIGGGTFGGPALTAGATRAVPIPSGACNVPSDAMAYALNVAVVPRGVFGFLTIWPSGQQQPAVSTLNSYDGRVKANAAIVAAGAGGAVSVFVTDTTDFFIDVNGYFVASGKPNALAFYPLTPCRAMDTRIGTGPLAGPALSAGQVREVPVQNSSCGLPANAAAYSLNFTAIPSAGPLGYLSVWPGGSAMPIVSTLNAPTGAITANAAIVPAGVAGSIALYASHQTDLVIDVNGYFAPPGPQGLGFHGLNPCRALDTRLPGPYAGAIVNGQRDFAIAPGTCGVPLAAAAFALNATSVPRGFLGFLALWPAASEMPIVSTLNALDGAVTSNAAIVPANNGSISAFASGATDLIFDVLGYFAR